MIKSLKEMIDGKKLRLLSQKEDNIELLKQKIINWGIENDFENGEFECTKQYAYQLVEWLESEKIKVGLVIKPEKKCTLVISWDQEPPALEQEIEKIDLKIIENPEIPLEPERA